MRGSRIFMVHDSASEYWIFKDCYDSLRTNCVPGVGDAPYTYLVAEAKRALRGYAGGEIHIAVNSANEARSVEGLRIHVRSMPYPKGSFCYVSRDLYVASPELCFLQAATTLTLPALILYGYELCGTYARTRKGDSTRYNRQPLTTVPAIRDYLAKSQGVKGVKRAQRAIKFVGGGSASPRESALVAFLSASPRLQGVGFPRPHLNYPIEVDLQSRTDIGKKMELHGDIVWPKARLVIEYDGEQHDEEANRALDRQRDHLLLDQGFKVIRVDDRQINSAEEVNRLIKTINREGRYRRRAGYLEMTQGRIDFLDELLYGCDLPWLSLPSESWLNGSNSD